jgi:hypothetical protein
VTLDDKQQYLIVHAILMTIKQKLGVKKAGEPYMKQEKLKFVFITEWNSSLLKAI